MNTINSSLSIFGISTTNNWNFGDKNTAQIPNDKNKSNVANLDELLKSYKDYYDELTKEIPIAKGSIQDQILKGELSQEDFKAQNKASVHWLDEDLQKEYVKIYHTSMSVEEFKQKWLDLQAKHEARFGEIAEKSRKDIEQEMQAAQEQYNNQKEDKETFKPIQAESKSETYKDEVKTNFWQQFLKVQQENGMDVLEILEILNKQGIDIKA
ncbi:hypothetical protein C3H34_08330 [Campylobacter jejuni]|uniref:hypothetical protein n=1 Tax=Campylobacter jejuni TaxID=197 RepID=UPI000F7FE58B|nr:hypothetical protein [Campylobacter jejuni]ECL9466575.1 hypothetical protein [Campylobacter jejuni]RTJ54054.1 hypothetical protein C3H71_02505 [Campylobacter jejuni]RTK16747.1 hypothetical protein C3H34_08330 [Campylobacter jejuni]